MSINDDLHMLLDQLDDDEAVVALSYLREILDDQNTASASRHTRLDVGMGPLVIWGHEFASMTDPRRLSEIAHERGIESIQDFASL